MTQPITRRQIIQQSAAVLGAGAVLQRSQATHASEKADDPAPRFCLNTSTLRGQKLTLPQTIDIVAEAGYDGIEPWVGEIQNFVQSGGKLEELRKQLSDTGLTVDSAIGFAKWIVDDDTERALGLENMKRDMDLVRSIGGTRIAAPPVGATDQSNLNLFRAAERYHALLQLGRSMEVTPQLELWGFSKSLSRLGELIFVAVEAAHPDACLLPDVYHIYKGGSEFGGLKMINGQSIHVMHMNDYPDIPREKIGDADRVYPGDGNAPLPSILSDLRAAGFHGTFSLELFNRDYWQQDAKLVARTGLEKMKAATTA